MVESCLASSSPSDVQIEVILPTYSSVVTREEMVLLRVCVKSPWFDIPRTVDVLGGKDVASR